MIFIKDQRAIIWEVEDKGKYTLVKMGTSRKDKQDGSYKTSNWSFVRFVGEAHKKASDLVAKDKIIIKSGGISQESYMVDGEKKWPKNPQIVVFDFDMAEYSNSGRMDQPPVLEDDEQMPF